MLSLLLLFLLSSLFPFTLFLFAFLSQFGAFLLVEVFGVPVSFESVSFVVTSASVRAFFIRPVVNAAD